MVQTKDLYVIKYILDAGIVVSEDKLIESQCRREVLPPGCDDILGSTPFYLLTSKVLKGA